MAGGWWSCLPLSLKGGFCVVKKVIAKVKLNPGQGGYFDPITRIHLTYGNPEGEVYAGMNTEGLKAAVRNKRISLVTGSLGESVPPFKLVKQKNGKVALVMNNPNKVVQQKSKTGKNTKASSEQESEIINYVKLDVHVEDLKPEHETTSVQKENNSVKQEENIITDNKNLPTESEPVESLNISDTKFDDSKKVNPFKKNKKKNSSKKEETVEEKTIEEEIKSD